MGPEDSVAEGLVLYMSDGQRIGTIQDLRNLPEVTVAAENGIASVMCPEIAEFSATFSVKMPKQWNCKGRKRFIKLVISMGYSRNYAVRFAEWARKVGIPYQDIWRTWFFWEGGGQGGAFGRHHKAERV